MKIESLYVEHQRRYARTQLPPDFARRVIEDARHNAGLQVWQSGCAWSRSPARYV